MAGAGLAGIEQGGGGPGHQVGGPPFGIGARDRELDRLVLTDRTPENDAFGRVGRSPGDKIPRVAERLGRDTFGGFAVAREFDIERKWRECRVQRIAPISTNLILAYIGQHVLDMPRSY
jgi:hypothetical protein